MSATLLDDPVLVRFRDGVRAVYGDRAERIVLFGSRARGDHRADSDYDMAVFLRDMRELWVELGTLAEVTIDVFRDTRGVISAKPFPAGEFEGPARLMREIRADGIEL